MADWVVCAECGTRYGAQTPFCTRCGSTARSATRTALPPTARDPRRMRVQLGGILLLLVGGLFMVGAAASLLNPGVLERQMFVLGALQEGAQGGTLEVLVLQDGAPLADANVTVAAGAEVVSQGSTSPDGRFNSTLERWLAVNVTVAWDGKTWVRQALVPQGATTEVAIDVAHDETSHDRVAGAGSLALTSSVAALGLSLLLALGGLAATLLRWRGLALGGPLPLVALSLLSAALVVSTPTFLFLALLAIPYALVVTGRSAFRRA